MSAYDDYVKETKRILQELDDLPEIRRAAEWERDIQKLVAKRGVPRSVVLKSLDQLIESLVLVLKMSEEDVAAKVDELIRHPPAN